MRGMKLLGKGLSDFLANTSIHGVGYSQSGRLYITRDPNVFGRNVQMNELLFYLFRKGS